MYIPILNYSDQHNKIFILNWQQIENKKRCEKHGKTNKRISDKIVKKFEWVFAFDKVFDIGYFIPSKIPLIVEQVKCQIEYDFFAYDTW